MSKKDKIFVVSLTSRGAMNLHTRGWQKILDLDELDVDSVLYVKESGGFSFFKLMWRVLSENNLHNLRVILANGEYNPAIIFLAFLAKCFNFSLIVTWHDATPHSGSISNYLYWVVSLINVHIAGSVIVHSKAFVKLPFLKGVKVHYLPLPPIILPPKMVDIEKKNRVLFFGRIERYKGLERLVSFFDGNDNASDLKLLVVGSGRNSYISHLGLNRIKSIEYLESLSDEQLVRCISESKAVVMPYIHCSQSLNPYWAEHCSVPLVISREVDLSMMLAEFKGCYVFFDQSMLTSILKSVDELESYSGDLMNTKEIYLEFLLGKV